MRVHLMELPDNYELELLGCERAEYKKGDRVLVHTSDFLRCSRLGLVEINSKVLSTAIFADAKEAKKETKEKETK